MLDLDELRVFLAVAQTESFAAAARQLEMPTSTVSRRVSSLEDHLEARLFTRTTRTVTLTDVGASFLSHARQLVSHALEAENAVRSLSDEPTGLLRVTAPVTLCQRILAELVADWVALHPRVEAEIISTDRTVDLVAEGIDVAFRPYPRRVSNLIVRKLGVGQRIMVASPEYLETHGRPQTLSDLREHQCIDFNFDLPGDVWSFEEDEIKVSTRLKVNDPEIALSWAIRGLGIARSAGFLAGPHIAAGELEQVLPDSSTFESEMTLVYPSSRHLSPKVRSFVDFAVERLAASSADESRLWTKR